MIERKVKRNAKIGIFAVAHGVYWQQFDGLYDKILKYHKDFVKMVCENDVDVIDFGIIDSNSAAYETAEKMQAGNVDLIFCNMVTYATSSVFAPILRNVNAPMVLTALQPREALDYTKANTFMQLENDNICSVPEFMCVAERMNKKIYDVIIGTLYGDEEAKCDIGKWCDIAKALNGLKGARIGLMGHVM